MILLRKISIISCSVFLQNVSVSIQALATFLVILACYLMHEAYLPYNVEQLNKMEKQSIIVSAVTIYCGLFFLTGELDQFGKICLFLLMVIANIVFLTYWVHYTFGYYIGKLLLRMNCCKRCFGKKLDKWISKVVPEYDNTKLDEVVYTSNAITDKDFSLKKINTKVA